MAPDATAYAHRGALLEVQFVGFVNASNQTANSFNDAWINGFYADVYPRLPAAGAGASVNYLDDGLPDA